jgi:hypothetical protein
LESSPQTKEREATSGSGVIRNVNLVKRNEVRAMNRREFVNFIGVGAAAIALSPEPVMAAVSRAKIRAIAFDGLAVFDVRPVAALSEQIFPGRGAELSALWRTRQFEYTWLRALGGSMRISCR